LSQEFDKNIVTEILVLLGNVCEEVCTEIKKDVDDMRSKVDTSIREKLQSRNLPIDETTVAFMVSAIILTIFDF
jgi:hypothetical protein